MLVDKITTNNTTHSVICQTTDTWNRQTMMVL